MNKLDQRRMDSNYREIDILLEHHANLIPKVITSKEILRIKERLYNKFGKHRDGKTKIHHNKKHYRHCWVTNSLQRASIDKGLPRMIHDISHRIDRIKQCNYVDNYKDHNLYQSQLELEMTRWAVQQPEFWNGTYAKKPKLKPTQEEKIKQLQNLIGKWKTKEMRALTYITKYKKKLSRLENKS